MYKKIKELSNNIQGELILGIFGDGTLNSEIALGDHIEGLIKNQKISTKLGKVTTIFSTGVENLEKIHFIGLGEKDKYDLNKVATAARDIKYTLGKDLIVDTKSFIANDLTEIEVVKALIYTIDFYNYQYLECKSKPEYQEVNISFITNISCEAFDEFVNICEALKNTRDLVNKPYNYLNVNDLVKYVEDLVKKLNNDKFKLRVYTKEECEAMGMNAFLGVNKGSDIPARLIYLTYEGSNDEPITLVGKGLMFDTGGYSLKTKMNTMKCDMGGAATVLGVMEAVVKNNLPVNLRVVIAATDNKVNSGAILPDDVLTAMDGQTIEIESTDAEGRLTLADAICFAQQEGSKVVIDVATLTGAVVVALGDYTTGLFGNDQELVDKILNSAKEENESLWQLPITDHIRDRVRKSPVADLINSTGRDMGASGAAAFLEAFVKPETKWLHLDIAGTAFNTSPRYREPYGATGAMVRTLYNFVKKN